MSNTFDSLSDEDVRQIALLVETLDRSTFDYLQVDVGDMKVTIGKGTQVPGAAPGHPRQPFRPHRPASLHRPRKHRNLPRHPLPSPRLPRQRPKQAKMLRRTGP